MTISKFLPAKEIQPEVTGKFFTYTRTLQRGIQIYRKQFISTKNQKARQVFCF